MIMEDLMAGKALATEIDEEIIFDQLQKKPGAIWSMLLASGYLKVVEKNFCQETGIFTYVLQLTNRESGFGRYDVLLEPLDKQSKAFVLEFKVRNSRREATLEDTLAAALEQIEKKDMIPI